MTIHNNYVTIAKAIGIMLMVVGHAGCPLWLDNFIYFFHMPLFFFCSGLFFKSLGTKNAVLQYIKKRINCLYVPFVKWSLFFLLLHNMFMFLGIYNRYYGYLGGSSYYDWMDYLFKSLCILFTMHEYEYLLGGFWFIRTLLISSLLISIASLLFRNDSKYRYVFLLFCFVILTIIIKKYCPKTELFRDISLGALGSVFYLAGYCYQQITNHYFSKTCLFVCLFVLLFANMYYKDGITMNCTYNRVVQYLFTGVSGSILILFLSKKIDADTTYVKKGLYYIGNHTLTILALHFLSFKIVSLAIVFIYGMETTHVAEHPVIISNAIISKIWWVFYSIVGVGVPLLIMRLWFFIKEICNRQIIGGIKR